MLAILFGLILGFVHFFSDKVHIVVHRMKTVSFIAGIFITYLFLHLLPYLYQGAELRISLGFLLMSFTIVHAIEKSIYRSRKSTEKIRQEVRWTHSLIFFVYHVAIGILFVSFLARSTTEGVLFFIPVFLFTTISSISLKEVHILIRKKGIIKVLLSASTLLGVFISMSYSMPSVVYDALLGIIVGTMLHMVLMDAMPKEREGRPEFFILGVVLYALLIAATWVF